MNLFRADPLTEYETMGNPKTTLYPVGKYTSSYTYFALKELLFIFYLKRQNIIFFNF